MSEPQSPLNPYLPPENGSHLGEVSNYQSFSFTADWSSEGLRQRRDLRLPNLMIVLVLALGCLWSICFVGWMLVGESMFACPFFALTYLELLFVMILAFGRDYRLGKDLANTHPSLAGPVSGNMTKEMFFVSGAGQSFATRGNALRFPSRQAMVIQGAVGAFPSTGLPLLESDVQTVPDFRFQMDSDEPISVLANRLGLSDSYDVSFELRAADFMGMPCFRHWVYSGVVLSVASVLCFIAVGYRISVMPSWVWDPPSHYIISQAEQFQVVVVWLVGILGIFLLFCSLFNVWKCFRRLGTFEAKICEDKILIGNKRFAVACETDHWGVFQWSGHGLEVRKVPDGQLRMLIPRRCFTEDQQATINQWLGVAASESKEAKYCGPVASL